MQKPLSRLKMEVNFEKGMLYQKVSGTFW